MSIGGIYPGSEVSMKVTNPLHYSDKKEKSLAEDDISGSFAEMFNSAVKKVNDQQTGAEEMTRKMIYEPGSVDIHSVMIAQQKAEVSLTFMKAVRDEAIRAYRDLLNMR